jgi:DNA-binding protein H-NS
MPKLTLDAIEKRIAALQKAAEELKKNDKTPALMEIVALMKKHDVSIGEVRKMLQSGPAGQRTGRSDNRKVVEPKYRDPVSGKAWTGRGKTPRWLVAAEEQGASRESFAIR